MTKLTKEIEDVVRQLRVKAADEKEFCAAHRWDFEEAADLIQSLSNRIDVLEGALREIAETLFVPYGEAETISEMKHIARASLIKEGGR